MVYCYHRLLTNSPVEEHSRQSQFFTITNKFATDTYV